MSQVYNSLEKLYASLKGEAKPLPEIDDNEGIVNTAKTIFQVH